MEMIDRIRTFFMRNPNWNLKLDTSVVFENKETKRKVETDIDEIMDLFLFVKKLKQGEDEIIKLLENRYEKEVKKNES